MEIMSYVLILVLNVLRFYEYIRVLFKYDSVIIINDFILNTVLSSICSLQNENVLFKYFHKVSEFLIHSFWLI